MKKYDNRSAARLPLVESVIVIGFFVLMSVAVMQMYLAADRLQRKSVNTGKATLLAENEMEAYLSGKKTDGLSENKGSLEYCYDAEWNLIQAQEHEAASFTMKVELDTQNGNAGRLTDIAISVEDASGEKYIDISSAFYSK